MGEMKSATKGGGKKLVIHGADASLHDHGGKGGKKHGRKKQEKGMKLPRMK